MVGTSTARKRATICALLVSLAVGGGCSTALGSSPVYQYFASPADGDAWSAKIRGWQQRERMTDRADAAVALAGGAAPGSVAESDLRAKYDLFRTTRKRELAQDLAGWIQQQAQAHYVADGPIDHWATLEETFKRNGDDCDGLELVTFNFLLELGFAADEVFRAIVVRRSDGQHHMVTLWFEDADDPWVIDPTGAMTLGMPRMSEMSDWVPLKLFTEDRDFTVRDEVYTAQR